MSTSTSNLVCDNSTVANFKQWGSAISSAFSTFTWVKTSDTGQVNWSTISSVPGTGAYVYEVWQPTDGISPNFYLKIEYGNYSGSGNNPSIRLTIGTSTDGAGTINSGLILGPITTQSNAYTIPSSVTQYECDFSGAAGRFSAMLWRNAPVVGSNNCPQMFFAIERSVNSSGAYTGTYATIYVAGCGNNTAHLFSRSIVFGTGIAPPSALVYGLGGNAKCCGYCLRLCVPAQVNTGTSAFNLYIPFDTASPAVGYFDYPGTVVGGGWAPDIVEATPFTVTLYGSTRTYLPSKLGSFQFAGPASSDTGNSGTYALCMRFD